MTFKMLIVLFLFVDVFLFTTERMPVDLVALILMATLLTEAMSNNATAALLAPIAIVTAQLISFPCKAAGSGAGMLSETHARQMGNVGWLKSENIYR